MPTLRFALLLATVLAAAGLTILLAGALLPATGLPARPGFLALALPLTLLAALTLHWMRR